MERVIATHHLGDHRLDVVELMDDDLVTFRLLVDDRVLPPDFQPDREPTPDDARAILDAWLEAQAGGESRQVPNRGSLHPREVIALLEALDDEHKAHATYHQVVADFGDVLPFVNIVEAEARHIAALTRLLERHRVPVPSNPWPGRVTRFDSLRAACEAAVEAEIANRSLYDRLMASTDRADILEVFQNLRDASEHNHLPAFQRCAEGGGPGRGQGRGHRRGHHHRDDG
jgi:hypothetical protein